MPPKEALCCSSTASQRCRALGRWDSVRPYLPSSLDWLWDRVYAIRDPGPTTRVRRLPIPLSSVSSIQCVQGLKTTLSHPRAHVASSGLARTSEG